MSVGEMTSASHSPVAVRTDQMETYVWGSNSSHQLTEGSQEKVMVAKLSTELSGYIQASKQMSLNYASKLLYCLYSIKVKSRYSVRSIMHDC